MERTDEMGKAYLLDSLLVSSSFRGKVSLDFAALFIPYRLNPNRHMSKRLAILQSNYIPWKGYFNLIHEVDEFILYDDVQYTRRDWRNRNIIKTPSGCRWLTIPVKTKGQFYQKISETEVSNQTWPKEHWKAIHQNYAKAPNFQQFAPMFSELYQHAQDDILLSQINYRFIQTICRILEINTKISWSSHYELCEGKTERLVYLCQQAGATEYISGPAARDYIETELFDRAGIKLTYFDYGIYPEYPQLHPPFEHRVSILDLILNVGDAAPQFMRGLER